MVNNQSDVDSIKQQLLISDVIKESVKLVKKGRYLYGLCPFHKEKTPSFSVNDGKGFFYCFGCGAKGDLFAFLMQTRKLSFYEALDLCAKKAGVVLRQRRKVCDEGVIHETPLSMAKEWFMDQFHANKEAKAYLINRVNNCDEVLLQEFEIGYAPPQGGLVKYLLQNNFTKEDLYKSGLISMRGNEYFVNRIIFPIKDRAGRVIGFGGRILPGKKGVKYLNSPESEVFKKRSILYPLDIALPAIRESRSVIVVEGYTDILALHKHGYRNSVACLGTAVNELQIEYLLRYAADITICFDGDQAGMRAAERIVKIILSIIKVDNNVYFVSMGAFSDPCDCLQNGDKNAFQILLNKAVMLSEFVWNLESSAVDSLLPERHAKLEKSLMEYVALIKDRDLRRYYRLYFLRRVRSYGYKSWSSGAIRYIPEIRLDHEYLVMRIVLDFPRILLDQAGFQEQFMDFDLGECSELQDLVIDSLEDDSLSTQLLEEQAKEFGLENLFLKVRLYTKNYHIDSYDTALLLWKRILTLSEIDALELEYRGHLHRSMDDESELKKASMILEIITRLKSKIRLYEFDS